ncbi:uncharacterized protein LY89DRAFT_119202 [Mollisia scopiformis]|uniref:Uncharacterized protein n=1 Tax=Mollisia scopiformis TaxID=149040 RepID=A0A194X3A9_MOLSC|nr:uncharacterized protein LY89DRAFT_119202 [Mollisia scopiformis]KUJ14678.1 hypothetical protein LY89DRAFT_119202 [Mollisia scopiformis]
MEVHDPENIEIDQYDINASLIPAEGAVVLNSSCLNVEVEEIQGGDEPGDEASGNLLSSTEQDSSPDNLDASDQTSVQEPTDLERRLSLSAQVDIATSRIQEAMNGAIDAMIEKLRSIRTDSSKDDIEAESSASLSIHTLPGVSVEPINYDVPQIFLTWPQDLRNPEVIQGEARLWQEALAKADLDQIPEMWTSTIWKPETKKSLIAQMALALKPTISQNEDSDALFDANSAIIVPCIGQMIQSDIDELRERSMYRDYAKFDQYPEILAKISIEALKLIRPTMTLGTLLQRCEEKKEDFKPVLFSTPLLNHTDLLALLISIHALMLGHGALITGYLYLSA